MSLAVVPVVLLSLLPWAARSTPASNLVRVGVGIADASWHVGAGSGQYSEKDPNAANLVTGGEIDPHSHGTTQQHSYGVQSRLSYRALVIEGADGKRVAIVKSDAYAPQDMLLRRAAQILAKGNSGIGYDQILHTGTHNHSSPYYTGMSWGFWIYQDLFDVRAFEYHARQMALAIERAAANMRPARMGATTVRHTIYKGQIAGPTVTDDGTPGGYPGNFCAVAQPDGSKTSCEFGDFGLVVMRFDDMTNPSNPTPLAVWVNWGQHPESNDGYALISADYLGPLERIIGRELGAPLVFSQGDVGSSEGPYCDNSCKDNDLLPDGVVRAWAHVGHAQTERGARYLANSIVEGWNAIGAGNATVPFLTDFPVDYATFWAPGPLSHPYPSVSNCRTESTVEGNPGSPILGLPDCERGLSNDPGNMLWENLKTHGATVPDHYDAPGFTAVEENMRIRLQVIRLGEVLLASCACEAQNDLILNFESRADKTQGNIWDGYDWAQWCAQNADTTWTCPNPGERDLKNTTSRITFSDARHQRMVAQVHNDAKGWDAPENVVAANSEPADPAKIWGNFTKEELPASLGFTLPIGIGHAGDYNGYTVSYREYMSRDHYRKALTSHGPHTADYMSTRLVRLAGSLKGGPAPAPELNDAVAQADEARQASAALALGALSERVYDEWLASLPNDAGPAAALTQPVDITRFQAATFTWRGGDNAVDNPVPRVERSVGGNWEPFADQSGEVQTMVKFPEGAAGVANTYAGNQEWRWTANLEAFDAFPATVIPGGQIPDGDYRFVVDGQIRLAGANTPYHMVSNAFHVGKWEGVEVTDAQTEPGGSVSFLIQDTYPRTYTSGFRFVKDDGNQTLCKTCSFRPWAKAGTVARATVTVTRANGSVETVAASLAGGRWVAATNLASGDHASVAIGGVVDSFGEINGTTVPIV